MKLLLLARDARWFGGVVAFVDLFVRSCPASASVNRLTIGRRFDGLARYFGPFVVLVDAMRLVRRVRLGRPDVVQFNPSMNLSCLVRDGALLFALRLLRYQHVVVFWHGWDDRRACSVARGRFTRRVFRWLFGAAKCSFVLAPAFADRLAELGVPKDAVHVTTTMFAGDVLRDAEATTADSSQRILFMSRVVRTKGVFDLLAAFESIQSDFTDAALVIAGDGPDLPALRDSVQRRNIRNVEFLGYVRDAEKARALRSTNVFVLPSYTEGCPVVLLEAMAVGLPCIATSVGGIPEVLHDGVNGILLEGANSTFIAAALRVLLSNPQRALEIGRRNRVQAWEQYEARAVTARLVAAYDAVARKA